jgi:hypothetical protein
MDTSTAACRSLETNAEEVVRQAEPEVSGLRLSW